MTTRPSCSGRARPPRPREPDRRGPRHDDRVPRRRRTALDPRTFQIVWAVKAVDAVNLDVREHDIHVFIGPNGAGKSTVLNLLDQGFAEKDVRAMVRDNPAQLLGARTSAAVAA